MDKTNFVQQVVDKDALGFQHQFNAAMNDKVSLALDEFKQEVAKDMFGSVGEE